MNAYYNDNDPFCCDWLQNLMDAGLITPGKIDDRSILDVSADDLKGFERVHFFAGIGGWDHALNLAGWQGPAWTGSCPCQPLSSAGKRKGHTDERHLWPAFQSLIAECRPATVFGEQVASKDGREWLAGVRADLESMGYACGAADLPAAGVGAPHIRQRLWWVADTRHINGAFQPRRLFESTQGEGSRRPFWGKKIEGGKFFGVGSVCSRRYGEFARRRLGTDVAIVAHGFPNRVGVLRGAGNAIVPVLAAEFVKAYMEAS